MGIILTSTGLPLLTSARLTAARAAPSRSETGPAPETSPLPEPKPDPGAITLQGPTSSISYRGVTFNFSSPVRWYQSANGDPVVISHPDYMPSGSSITSISPASTSSASGAKINGTMKNHANARGVLSQGFDGAPGNWPEDWRKYTYTNAQNVDPGNTGSAIKIATGESCSIIKAVRDTKASESNWKVIQKYVVLTIMGSLPPRAGTWFRPNPCTAKKSWPGKPLEEMDFTTAASPLRHLAKPSGLNNPSVYLAEINAQELTTLPLWMTTYEGRVMQLTGETAASSGYARDYGRQRGMYACSLFIDQISLSEQAARRDLAARLIQWGIDTDGGVQVGMTHSTGAGQWYGYIEFHYIAAFMLGDADMLGRAQIHNCNSIGQCFWITENEIGYPNQWNWGNTGSNGEYVGETYPREMLGKPEWGHSGWSQANINATSLAGMTDVLLDTNASLPAPYRDTIFTTQIYELMSIALLRNGPNGETGIAAINRGASVGPGNLLATAALPYLDRSIPLTPVGTTFNIAHSANSKSVYNLWRNEIPQPRWTGKPDIAANQGSFPNFSTPGSGSGTISWSLNNHDLATETVTNREISYSQDGVQFSAPASIGTSTTHTLTGLRPGTAHWCRWRQTSASGSGPWSQTWVQHHAGASTGFNALKIVRGKVNSSGSVPGGGFVNSVAPALCIKPYPRHEMPYYERASASVAAGMVLYAGIGYWTGGTGSLSASYQWQKNGGNISGATSQSYAVQAGDRGANIRCVVTVGGVSANSNAVSIP